jgi:ribonuclease J
VWAIPLGGMGEFGMNMLVLRTGDDIIVIDAGLMFPEQELLGVDIVIPDITYLKQNKRMIRAIVLTHAHEDHIGAIPYIITELGVPIYGTKFTLALVRKKLEEHALLDQVKLHEVGPGDVTTLGPFQIEYLHVTHSTIDCVALAVRTPLGVIIHTGDFKIDPTPVDGKPFDLHAFARYGQEGVLALFSDSTNVERPGSCVFPTAASSARRTSKDSTRSASLCSRAAHRLSRSRRCRESPWIITGSSPSARPIP